MKFIFIRHGEKPLDLDNKNLSPEGYSRSIRIASDIPFDKPLFLIAPKPKSKRLIIPDIFNPPEFDDLESLVSFFEGCKQVRSLQTIIPIAKRLSLPIHCSCMTDDIEGIIRVLLAFEKKYKKDENVVILICWEHKIMGEIVKRLLSSLNAVKNVSVHQNINYPKSNFNIKWEISQEKDEKVYNFKEDFLPF
jgi:hypothetical protein